MARPRMNQTFSLDADMVAALKARAAEEGEPASRLVDRYCRAGLAMPAAPREEGDETEEVATRAERTVLEVIRGMPPGAYFTHEINEVIAGAKNKPIGVTLRSLAALARRGEVHLWNAEFPTGAEVVWSTWSTMRPAELVSRVIAVVQRAPADHPVTHLARAIELIAPLARKMTEADAAAARAALLAVPGWNYTAVGQQVITEAVALQRAAAERLAKNAAWEAKTAAERLEAERVNAENARKHAAYDPNAPPKIPATLPDPEFD